jgi:uncharacterized protein with ParB-like and HNH nuclease domain
MNNLNEIKFEVFGIGKFISDTLLRVPINQRAFAWEEKNVTELFEDIYESQPHDYFIGSIVISQTEDENIWKS